MKKHGIFIAICTLIIVPLFICFLTVKIKNNDYKEIYTPEVPIEYGSEDTSPNTTEELLADILEIQYNYQSINNSFDSVNQEIFNSVVSNLQIIDIAFLKAIWHSRGKIVITDGSLTDLDSLSHLKGEETCEDALNTCRSFDEINGLHYDNVAYLRIRTCSSDGKHYSDIRSIRNFCDAENKIYSLTATLFHETGHLLDQSIALIEQFGDLAYRRISDLSDFKNIHSSEYENLFSGLPGPIDYFRASWEYAAESFAMFYGYNSSHELRNRNILRERAPKTYNHFINIIYNYNPRPTERW